MRWIMMFLSYAAISAVPLTRSFAETQLPLRGDATGFEAFGTNMPAVLWMEVTPGKKPAAGQFVFMAIWPDGSVLKNRSMDASLSLVDMTRIDPATVRTLLSDIVQTGVFDTNALVRTAYYGFDSPYWVIELSIDGRHCRLESWHNLWQANPKLIVVDGVVKAKPFLAVGKRYRNSPEYKRFLEIWENILTHIREIRTGRSDER